MSQRLAGRDRGPGRCWSRAGWPSARAGPWGWGLYLFQFTAMSCWLAWVWHRGGAHASSRDSPLLASSPQPLLEPCGPDPELSALCLYTQHTLSMKEAC